LKRAQFIAPVSVLVLTLVLLNLPASVATRLKLALSSLFLPLFGLTAASQSFLDRASYEALPREVLISEIEKLRKENAQLRITAAQGDDALAENRRLRQALQSAPRGPWKLRVARVVGREPTTWWRMVQIDLGSRDGLAMDQVVVSAEGLVGRVSQVSLTHAQVALVGDAACGVSVLVRDTRDLGIIKAGQPLAGDGTLVELTLLQNSPTVMSGQAVVTSGQGGVFPSGLPVGTILDTRSVEAGLFTTARLRLAANLNRLEEVWVLQ
jgi:rod shape-determining protein MreC